MTMFFSLLLLSALAAVSAGALAVLSLALRARNKRRLLALMRGVASDSAGGIGISVLCSGADDLRRIERLLSVEYARYEVVAVVDAARMPELFASLVGRYRMIRVECLPARELPVCGVRALLRSRARSFRRLLLVDRAEDTPEGDFDAAACVATYDYLLPLPGDRMLLPGAVERLVAEAGEAPAGGVVRVRSRIGAPVSLFAREAVTAAGGFSGLSGLFGFPGAFGGFGPFFFRCRFGRRPARGRVRNLWEPLGVSVRPAAERPRAARWCAALLLAGGVVAAAALHSWPVAAVLLTAALVRCVAGALRTLFAPAFRVAAADRSGRRRSGRIFSVKNFTMS